MVARVARGGLRDCYILYNFMSVRTRPLGELINYNLSAGDACGACQRKIKSKTSVSLSWYQRPENGRGVKNMGDVPGWSCEGVLKPKAVASWRYNVL